MSDPFLKHIKPVVEQAIIKGLLTKPAPAGSVDPQDYGFIRELKQRGASTSEVAETLHVTEEALAKILFKLKLE